jgi:hypothetical protein
MATSKHCCTGSLLHALQLLQLLPLLPLQLLLLCST